MPPGAPLGATWGARFTALDRLGDLDSDGSDELAVGRPGTAQVLIYSLRLDGVTNFGPASVPAPTAKIGVHGVLQSGGQVTFNYRDAVPNALGVLMVGFSDQWWGGQALPMNLGVIGLPNASLLVSPDVLDYTYADTVGARDLRLRDSGGPVLRRLHDLRPVVLRESAECTRAVRPHRRVASSFA